MNLILDTTPPSGVVETVPAAPVQALSNTPLQVNLSLSEPAKSGTVPQLSLDPPEGAPIAVAMSGSGTNWTGTATLTPLMGSGLCTFSLQVSDALDNAGTTITKGQSVEIYNTALPSPPAAPNLLNPASQKGGYVRLVWYPVSNAETYNLYRMPGDTGTPATVVTSGITTNAVDDLPPVDGNYRYAVSAERRGSESGLSTVYTKYSDRTPPGAPGNVGVQLQASGVQVIWTAPTEGEAPIRYNVYRSGTKIASPYVPTPVSDYPPRGTSVYYVASSDWLGNEAFSETNEFIMLVPAVSVFSVLVNEDNPPQLSWTTGDGSIVGVNLYRNGSRLNASPLTASSYVDSSYSGNSQVTYEIRSVNGSGQEGPGRVANVYRLGLNLTVNEAGAGLPVLYYFDAYSVSVENRTLAAAFPMQSIELRRTYAGAAAVTVLATVTSTVPAGASVASKVDMASMTNATAQSVRVRLLQTPDASGAQVIYQRLFSFDDSLLDSQRVSVTATNTPVLGALNNFKVRLFNRGYADMDVVLVKANGSQPGDVYVSIQNALGEEVSRSEFRGSLPGMMLSSDGRGYVTVGAGAYLDIPVDVLVPVGLEGDGTMKVVAGAKTLYHKLGSADEQQSGPISGSARMSVTQTEYYGTSATDKANYANEESVVITGQALRRSDDAPLPNTPLRIGFAMGSHRWYEEVLTDGTGSYRFVYSAPQGASGQLSIWAAHPEVVDRLDQQTVGFYRMYVLPRFGDIRMSKNDTYQFSLNLMNPSAERLTHMDADVRAYRMEGTNEINITTVTATPLWTPGMNLEPKGTQPVTIRLQTAMDAPDHAVVEIRFHSTDMGAADTFVGYLTLLEAVPVVDVVEPASGYLDVTVNRGHLVTRTITIANRGVREYIGVRMSPPTTLNWIVPSLQLNADGTYHLPDLPVGASNTFDVVFAPPEGMEMVRTNDAFVISGTNHPATFSVPLYATISSADKGSLQVYVQNTLSLPVPGATLRLRNRLLGTEMAPVKTDTNGLVRVENLQEGLWYWQVTAPGHTSQSGSIEIMADQVNELSTRLVKNVVTVTFSVVPVLFTDRYEIKIEQTFETHVPIPVLVLTPNYQEFRGIDPGFEATFTVTAKNQGLIALRDFKSKGEEYSWGSITPLIEYMPELGPMQEVQIPIHVVYNGTSGGGAQSQRQSWMSCMKDMGTAILGFEDAVKALIARSDGKAECPKSLDVVAASAIVTGLLFTKDAIEPGLGWADIRTGSASVEMAMAAFGCLFSSLGDSGGSSSVVGVGGGPPFHLVNKLCFDPSTKTLLADGNPVEMDRLAAGDIVQCGPNKGEIAPVAEVLRGMGSRWVVLTFDDGPKTQLVLTDEHQVWVDGKGWTTAKTLKIGDPVITAKNRRIRVSAVKQIEENRPFVSVRLKGDAALYANGILVHDQCGRWMPPKEETKKMEVKP